MLNEQRRWTPDMPMYSHVKGMYAFGLEECNEFAEGERVGKEALSLNRNDAWATHAVAHVFEMQGRSNEGVRFMTNTLNDWEPCNYLACHNMWHWAVYHIDRKEYATALGIFEREVCRCHFSRLVKQRKCHTFTLCRLVVVAKVALCSTLSTPAPFYIVLSWKVSAHCIWHKGDVLF